MRRSFILSLLSSWLVNPVGILIAHLWGASNTTEVLILLLAMGAGAPFQLYLNECLAATTERTNAQPSRLSFFLILALQCLACLIPISPMASGHWLFLLSLIGLLAFSNLISYEVSVTYYGLAIKGSVSPRQAVLVGAIPGITTIFLFVIYCAALGAYPVTSSFIVLLISFAPTLAQKIYAMNLARVTPTNIPSSEIRSTSARKITISAMLLPVGLLCVLTTTSTFARESIGRNGANYMALILVGLNSLTSLTNTLTRIVFFSNHPQRIPRFAWALIAFIFAAALLVFFLFTSIGLEFSLFALSQIGIIGIIQRGRRRTVQLAGNSPKAAQQEPKA
jgi:hypothetical protein